MDTRFAWGGALDSPAALALMLLLLLSIMTGPVVHIPSDDGVLDVRPESAGDRVLRIGWVGLTDSIATLNPLWANSSCEKAVVWPCYSTLLTYDEDGKVVGDLARSWRVSPDGLNLTFHLYESAVWYDKNSVDPYQPVTGHDVVWTYFAIQNSSNLLDRYFPRIDGEPVIKSMVMNPTDDWDLTIQLSMQYAPIIGTLSSVPILPKYIWESRTTGWANFDRKPLVAPCIGSGPFYYNQDGLPSSSTVELARNPTWYATEERGWQLRCNRLVYVSEASDADSLADFQNGQIDIMELCTSDQYLHSIPMIEGAIGQRISSGFVYELNANQMTDSMRTSLGGSFLSGSNSQLLLDPVVKSALSLSVDKQSFIDQVNAGLGQTADSIVPNTHPYYYDYGGPTAPENETEWGQSISGARELLYASGWRYRTVEDGAGEITLGSPDYATYYPLCKVGGADQLSFRFCTLSESPEWDVGGRLVAGWAEEVGFDIWSGYELKSLSEMNIAWSRADYDLWLWDWNFDPSREISTDILFVMTTDSLNSWSDVFYSNSTYDNLYNQSLVTIEPNQRRVFTDEMQRMVYEDHGCQPVAYRDNLFAMKASAPDNWGNWGNWTTQWALEPSRCHPWLYMMIEPADNSAPDVTVFSHYVGLVNTEMTMTASGADDASSLEYRWAFGDGFKSDWSSSPATSHTYTTDGYFTATVMAREVGSSDAFISHADTTVVVRDPYNSAPRGLDFTYVPANPNSGEIVNLSGLATDDEDDPLSYSWDFGDGTRAVGQFVSHQFKHGSSAVTMYVDDGHLGTEARPVAITKYVSVSENSPPSIQLPDCPCVSGQVKRIYNCTCTDLDPGDQIRLTWDWGDGMVTVTNHQSNGGSINATTTHTYSTYGYFRQTVWIDDMTGLSGHNVSEEALANVCRCPPETYPQYFVADDYSVEPGTPVTFSLLSSAWPYPEYVIAYTIDFGDGASASIALTNGIPWIVQHTYQEGLFFASATMGMHNMDLPSAIEVKTSRIETHLVAGWNLFSLPLLANYTASSLGLPTGSIVAGWNSSSQLYDKIFVVGVSLPFKDFAIEEGLGYWILASSACSLVIQGSVLTTIHYYHWVVPTGGGWVLVGFPNTNVTWYASQVQGWCDPPDVNLIIVRYDPVTMSYKTYVPGLPFTDFVLVPGEGYWVHIDRSVIVAYGPR